MKFIHVVALLLSLCLSCQDSGPEPIDHVPDLFKPEDIVGQYSGFCVEINKHFNPVSGQITVLTDTLANSHFQIDSVQYLQTTNLYKVYTYGDCQSDVNYFVPDYNIFSDTVRLIQLTVDYSSHAYIDTIALDMQTHFQRPEQGLPGGFESWGYYKKDK